MPDIIQKIVPGATIEYKPKIDCKCMDKTTLDNMRLSFITTIRELDNMVRSTVDKEVVMSLRKKSVDIHTLLEGIKKIEVCK